MSVSSIEWTDRTWNPTVGCSRVSEGCRHCYAEVMAARLANAAQATLRKGGELTATMAAYRRVVRWERGGKDPADLDDKALPRWSGRVELVPERLAEPLSWKQPARVFVNSMSDLFHEALSFEQIAAVFGVAAACPHLEFQVLTKRPEVAVEFFGWLDKVGSTSTNAERCGAFAFASTSAAPKIDAYAEIPWPLPNLRLGVSAEDQETADLRIPEILQCPAAIHFVSYEPALGPIDFTHIRERRFTAEPHIRESWRDALAGKRYHYRPADALSGEGYYKNDCPRIGWVIAGGESGPGARPPEAEWFRSVRDQCVAAGVPYLFKQWGQWAPYDQLPEETKRDLDASGAQLCTDPLPMRPLGVGKKRAGRELDGETWDQFPEVSP